jgi:hypothetical protein
MGRFSEMKVYLAALLEVFTKQLQLKRILGTSDPIFCGILTCAFPGKRSNC